MKPMVRISILFVAAIWGIFGRSLASAQWEARWEKSVAAAKREGEVMVYLNAPSPHVRPALTTALSEKFGIRMNVVVGTGPELSARIVSEYQAGIHQVDVSFQGCSTLIRLVRARGFLSLIEPWLTLPEVKDPKLWFGGKLTYDKDGTAFRFIAHALPPIAYNTGAVKQEAIESYGDLLKPEWKGKIVMHDPTIFGAGANGISYLGIRWGLNKAKEYLTSLVKEQDAVISRDYRQQVEWVARGKYALGLWPNPGQLAEFAKIGAPVAATQLKEGAVVSPAFGCLGIPTKPSHPNAAAVFLNWFLSREGQSLAVKSYGLPSARLDVPPEGVLRVFVISPGQNVHIEDEEFNSIQDKWFHEWKAIVALGKK